MITCMYVVIALHTKIVSQAWAKLHTQILSWISVMYGHHPYRTLYVKLFHKPLCTMLQFLPSVTEQPAFTVGHHWCSSVSLQKETVSYYTYMYSRIKLPKVARYALDVLQFQLSSLLVSFTLSH